MKMPEVSINFNPATGRWLVEIKGTRGSGYGEHWLLFVAVMQAVLSYMFGM
jgi:hypothetical protein